MSIRHRLARLEREFLDRCPVCGRRADNRFTEVIRHVDHPNLTEAEIQALRANDPELAPCRACGRGPNVLWLYERIVAPKQEGES